MTWEKDTIKHLKTELDAVRDQAIDAQEKSFIPPLKIEKRWLFDVEKFNELALYYASDWSKVDKLVYFIQSEIERNTKEAVRDFAEKILKTKFTSAGNNDFFKGVDHARKLMKELIYAALKELDN